jgi:hypothetical protein
MSRLYIVKAYSFSRNVYARFAVTAMGDQLAINEVRDHLGDDWRDIRALFICETPEPFIFTELS